MSDGTETIFEAWALVEVFGHSKYAGKISEQKIGNNSFVRVDVPATGEFPAFTKMFGEKSIFSMTIVAEDVARKAAESFRSRPVDVLHYPHNDSQRYLGYEDEDDYR